MLPLQIALGIILVPIILFGVFMVYACIVGVVMSIKWIFEQLISAYRVTFCGKSF